MPKATPLDDIRECKHLAAWMEDLAERVCDKMNPFAIVEDGSISVSVRGRMLRGRGQADCLRALASDLKINMGLAYDHFDREED